MVLHATEVHVNDVRQLWQDKGAPGHDVSFMLVDGVYRVLPEHEIMAVVKSCHVDAIPYQAEFMDCDKHSRLLWGLVPTKADVNSVGIVFDFSGKHSYNVAVVYDASNELAIRYIEPQTSKEIKLASQPCYKLERGLVII